MGRARAQSKSGFDAVLGVRRGLGAVANAQREETEASEREQREYAESAKRELAEQLQEWGERADLDVNTPLVQKLVKAYEEGRRWRGHVNPSDPSYVALVRDLRSNIAQMQMAVLADIAGVGDPVGWPGFSEPVVRALGEYFSAHGDMRASTGRTSASYLIKVAFLRYPLAPNAHYERLQPICEGLGLFLLRQSPANGYRLTTDRQGVCALAAQVLRQAPADALSGPLRSWVHSFAQRWRCGFVTKHEHKVLQKTVKERGQDPAFAAAFAAIIRRLPTTKDVLGSGV